MDKVEIQIVELKIFERLFEGWYYILFSMFIVPQLGGDPELIARNASIEYDPQRAADQMLVAINSCAVEMTIAYGCGSPAILSEPKVPSPIAGIVAPVYRTLCGTFAGSTPSCAWMNR